MAKKTREPFLETYTKLLHPQEKKSLSAIKDQALVPIVIDILSRQQQHHVCLLGCSSPLYNRYFIEVIAQQLHDEHVPKTLRDAHFYFIDSRKLFLNNDVEQAVEEFAAWTKQLSDTHLQILCLEDSLHAASLLNCVMDNSQFLIILLKKTGEAFTNTANENFSTVKLNDPTANDAITILKMHRNALENFHHVIIPDETFAYAYSSATHYLSGSQASLDKALNLLDSGAARANATERHEAGSSHKAILTNNMLANLVSTWTQIPLTYLQHHKFKAHDFTQHLQKYIFGQEAAINLIALALQYSRIKLHTRSGPLCSFLFAGPANVGKRETALAIAEYLFGHQKALLHININKTYAPKSLAEISVSSGADEIHTGTLLDAIGQMPYAVLLLENVNQAPVGTLDLFQDIFSKGYTIDQSGHKHDFRHSIFIVTTTLGTEKIISLSQPQNSEANHTADLMQLVMNEHIQDGQAQPQHLSPQELCQEMMPALETYFSNKLLSNLNIIPFVLLDYPSVEKIIRLKLKSLGKYLDAHYGLELSYAPEVVRFLVQEALWRGENKSLEKVLEHQLYSCIAHELVSHLDDKNRPKRIVLQLNDAGQVLRAEFVVPSDTTLYQL